MMELGYLGYGGSRISDDETIIVSRHFSKGNVTKKKSQ